MHTESPGRHTAVQGSRPTERRDTDAFECRCFKVKQGNKRLQTTCDGEKELGPGAEFIEL